MAIVQEVHLTQDKKRIAPVVYAVQNDTGRDLKMVVDDETLVAGMTGKLAFERPDGTYYEASGTLDTATNSFTAEEDQALTKAGTVRCQLKVYDAFDDLVSSFFFSISVEPDASGAPTEQEGWTIKDALDTAEEAKDTAEDAKDLADAAIAELTDLKKVFAPLITETISDQPIASFDDGADNWPVKDLQVSIEAVQDLHGQANPYPAGGGKNKFDGTFLQGYWAFADGVYANSDKWIATSKIPCKASTAYTTSATTKMTRWQGFVWYDSNGDYISSDSLNSDANIGITKTSPSNAAYMVFNIGGYPGTQATISTTDVKNFQIEEGSSATSWSPYENICPISGWSEAKIWVQETVDQTANPTVTISLGSTRYGGVLDVTQGKLSVTHWYYDLSNLTWTENAAPNAFNGSIPGENLPKHGGTVASGAICSKYTGYSSTTVASHDYGFAMSNAGGTVYVKDKDYSDLATFEASLSGVQLVYELQTPKEVTLTAEELETILGTNNIFSDCGNVSVEYGADTKLWILKKIAEAIA